jgi:plastocyanin
VHYLALQMAPVLAAEKSKVPFYIAGGLLVAWALFISMAVGMRKPDFPANLGQQRAVMGVTALLVLFAVSMAVVTSGGDSKAKVATQPTASSDAGSEPATAETSSTASTPTSTPKATTGTPAPASSPAAAETAAPAETKLALAADPGGQLSYDTTKLAAKAGKVTITMANMSPIEHNVTIAEGSKVLGATPTFVGGSKTVTVTLKPGTYTFYCSVPGHKQAGMEGTLTVS